MLNWSYIDKVRYAKRSKDRDSFNKYRYYPDLEYNIFNLNKTFIRLQFFTNVFKSFKWIFNIFEYPYQKINL